MFYLIALLTGFFVLIVFTVIANLLTLESFIGLINLTVIICIALVIGIPIVYMLGINP